ncbi:hypothetical protein [Nocardia sp. XZ_19_385]|uniref:hypothetical protein n=1 Tax=Nocardia sp. XZ_19_385 TaxID=2769488 RepID=UPI00188FB613|nr:hypothetical protein [Nocardia sp. XZ_19_385]
MPPDLNKMADRFGQFRKVFNAPTIGQQPVQQVLGSQLAGLMDAAGMNPLDPSSALNLLDPNLGNEQARNPGMVLFGRYILSITVLQGRGASVGQVREMLAPLAERLEGLARAWSSGSADAEELEKLNEESRELAEEARGLANGRAV